MSANPAKVTAAQRAEIIRRVRAGESYGVVAAEVALSQSTVRKVAIAAGVRSTAKSTSKSPWNREFTRGIRDARPNP